MKLKDMLKKLIINEFSTDKTVSQLLFHHRKRSYGKAYHEGKVVTSFQDFLKVINSLKGEYIIEDITLWSFDLLNQISKQDLDFYLVKDVLLIIDELEQEHPHLFV